MKRKMNAVKLVLVAAFSVSAISVAGCGIKGELKTPPPVWGDSQPVTPETTTS